MIGKSAPSSARSWAIIATEAGMQRRTAQAAALRRRGRPAAARSNRWRYWWQSRRPRLRCAGFSASADTCCGLRSGATLTSSGTRRRSAAASRAAPRAGCPAMRCRPSRVLQLAQTRGVRRGDIHSHVIRMRVDLAQAGHVVVVPPARGRIEVLADADAANSAVARLREPRDQMIDALVVEAHAIDQRAAARGTRNMRGFGLPGCGRGVTVPSSM